MIRRAVRRGVTGLRRAFSSSNKQKCTLYYFAIRGHVEKTRLLLHHVGVPYDDVYLTHPELRKLKATGSPTSNPDYQQAQDDSILPFGSLPVLTLPDGTHLAQSSAINQWVASQSDQPEFLPEDPVDSAKALMVVQGHNDFFGAYWPIKKDMNRFQYHSGQWPTSPGVNAQPTEAKAAHLPAPFGEYSVPRDFRRSTLPRWLTCFESLLGKNQAAHGSEAGFVGQTLTYADIVSFDSWDVAESILPGSLDSFPRLKAHKERIGALPSIAAYLESRPASGL